jgi:hypothetical protein
MSNAPTATPQTAGLRIPFPIERGAAIRAEMKSNAIAAIGLALVSIPLTVEPRPLFRIARTEMESVQSDAGTPCSGTDKPYRVHPWQSLEASHSAIARFELDAERRVAAVS